MSTQKSEQLSAQQIAAYTGRAVAKLIVWIVLYVIVGAVVQWIMTKLLPSFGVDVSGYAVYVQILLAIAFGYLIVSAIAEVFYWSLRARYPHATAAAVRNIIKIVGVGALAASIAGAVSGGAAGVALGGFLGIVIGFATQQVLGQAVAGLFLLIVRPFKIGDAVTLVGEDGVVEDVATLFTVVRKADGTVVYIPNNAIIGSKIYLKKPS